MIPLNASVILPVNIQISVNVKAKFCSKTLKSLHVSRAITQFFYTKLAKTFKYYVVTLLVIIIRSRVICLLPFSYKLRRNSVQV